MTALLCWAAVADAAQLQVVVEPSSLVQGQIGSARVLLALQGREQFDSQRPPPLPTDTGLRGAFVGQFTQMQRVNFGAISRVVQFEYQLTALTAGRHTVGPLELVLADGTHVTADAVEVTVLEKSVQAAAEVTVDARITSSRQGSPPRAWEGQVVLYERTVTSRAGQLRVQWGETELSGLRPDHLAPPEERQYRVADPAAGTLDVVGAVYPLVATGRGHHDLGPAMATVALPSQGGGPFGRRTEVVVSEPVTVDVDALPPAPPGFTGLVGDFQLVSRLDAGEVQAGASVPWTLILTGDGSLEGLKLPKYDVPGVSVYDSDPRIEARVQGERYLSTATFSRVLVPTTEGDLRLPDLDLVVFSPSKGVYEHLTTTLPTLKVVPGREGNGEVTAFGTAPATVADDPAVPREVKTWGRATAPSLRTALPVALAVVASPGLLVWLGIARDAAGAWWSRRRRVERDREPTARELMARLPEDVVERLAVLDHVLRLCEATSDAAEVRELRRRLGRVRFGGGPADPSLEEDLRRLVERAALEAA